MSVMDSEKINIQTTWNMEMPYEMMLGLKEQVPVAVEMVSDPAIKAYNKISRHVRSLQGSFEKARKQGKAMFNRAFESLAELNLPDIMSAVTEKTILILKEYKRKVEHVLDAIVKLLRETKFQIPGYEERLSGLEIYQKYNAFVADLSEEAVQKFPEYFASMFASAFDYFEGAEFRLPGSDRIVTGREFLNDLLVALRKIQDQVIMTVRKLGDIQLEDIFQKYSAFMQFTIEQSERLLEILKSQNVESLSTFVTDVYDDAINSRVLVNVFEQFQEVHRIVMEYLKVVTDKLYSIVAGISTEQLREDIRSWIDSSVKRINNFQNNVIRTLKEKSKDVEPYVRVGDKQIDVDIPLPSIARFM